MAVRVVISKGNPEVPDEFIFSVLSSTLGIEEEEYRSIKREDGSVSLYVKDPEAIVKLQNIAEKHASLINVAFEKPSSGGGLFSLTNTSVKSNWGLVLSWGAVVLLMFILSMVPIFGIFINLFLSVFYYAFSLFVAHKLLGADLSPESVKELFGKLRLAETFSEYLGAGFGFWLGFLVLYILSFVVFGVIAVLFGGLGAVSDLMNYGRVGSGTVGAMFLVFLLMFIFWLWVFYAFPLMVARALSDGNPTLGSSFKAVVSVLTPSFLKESFSGSYVGIGGMWSLAVTVGIIGFLLTVVLIVTIPVAILILYWLQVFLSMSAVSYIKRS